MSRPSSHRTSPATTQDEARRATKCTRCGIRLDVPCTNPICDGHGNENHGNVCVYCATNERANRHFLRKLASPLFAALYDTGHGEEGAGDDEPWRCLRLRFVHVTGDSL